MIGNPLALLGLLAIAVPVLIHLLGRHRSRVQRFPTLRFIPVSRLAPSRRRTLSDLPLLLVRASTVAVAAVALSQPYFACADRGPGSATLAVSRAVVIDTSASMRRGGALDSARQIAAATTGVVARIETDDVAAGVSEAGAWLATRDGTRELEIVSDFQSSSFDASALVGLPTDVGIGLTRVPATTGTPSSPVPGVTALYAPASQRQVVTGWRAAGASVPDDSASRVAIIYEGHPEYGALAARAAAPDQPWMGRVIASIARDPLVRMAASTTASRAATVVPDTLARGASGEPVVGAGRINDRLMIFVSDAGDGVAAVAVNRAVVAMLASSPGEADATYLAPAELAALERPATQRPGAPAEQTDASLFWLGALLLTGIETLMRRRGRGGVAAAQQQQVTDNSEELAA